MSDQAPIPWEELSPDEVQEILAEVGPDVPPEHLRELLDLAMRLESLDGLRAALDRLDKAA